ncbi:MAG TPA: FAD-dependent monooxygenase [Jatrophihabitans sp.]
MSQQIETDVLIVGSGPAGASAALALSSYGVRNIVVTKYSALSDTPRAHITNQRTMEVLRDLGVEPDVIAAATPQHLMGNTVFCTSLAGEELGRLWAWGNDPYRQADHEAASPTRMNDTPQHLMEPILITAATSRGTTLRFNTSFESLQQDADGVTVTVHDRLREDDYQIRAKYVIGADGGRSAVANAVDLPMAGQMAVAGSINICFTADLSRYVAHRPSVLYWVLAPGADVGGIGAGLVRMVRPWNEWLIVWGYDVSAGAPDLSEDYARSIARTLIGDDDIDLEITSSSAWTVNHAYATRYSAGRVFCAGDAVHRHPPSNGLGSNTSIQDSYNLAWKLKLVLDGIADPTLLDSYTAERAPIGRQVVDRANLSIAETAPIFAALGLLSTDDPEQMRRNMAARTEATPEAERQRRELREAIRFKDYEFNAHGVEMNQRYVSQAVVDDGSPDPGFDRDPELFHQLSSRPGAKVPHAWLGRGTQRLSTLDVCGHGRFTLLTGIGGEGWAPAVEEVSTATGLPIDIAVIGPGRDYQDLYGTWSLVREVTDSGCLLVRPDGYVCFRHVRFDDGAADRLNAAVHTILAKG